MIGFKELFKELDFIPKGLRAPRELEVEQRFRDAHLVVM